MKRPRLPKLDPIVLGDGFELDIDYYLSTDYLDITQAAAELPPIIEWVNQRLQDLTEQKIIKRQQLKEVEAEAYFALRAGGFSEQYADKMTEASLEKAVCLAAEVKNVHREYAVLAGWVQRLINLQQSLQAKLDLVRTSEATRRRLVDPEAEIERV